MKIRIFSVLITSLLLTACAGNATKDEVAKAKQNNIPLLIGQIYEYARNSVGGIDIFIKYENTSNKTFKYVNFTLAAYNAVGDLAPSRISNSALATLEDVGPLMPGNHTQGTWENVWYNGTISCFEVSSLEVTYMDGSSIKLSNNEISQILSSSINSFTRLKCK